MSHGTKSSRKSAARLAVGSDGMVRRSLLYRLAGVHVECRCGLCCWKEAPCADCKERTRKANGYTAIDEIEEALVKMGEFHKNARQVQNVLAHKLAKLNTILWRLKHEGAFDPPNTQVTDAKRSVQ